MKNVFSVLVLGLLLLGFASESQAQFFSRRFNTTPRVSQPKLPVPASFYIDEKELPAIAIDADFGKKYQNIIVDGQKLDWSEANGYYVYTGTKDKAVIMSGNGDFILTTPARRDPKTGKVKVRLPDGSWADSDIILPPTTPNAVPSTSQPKTGFNSKKVEQDFQPKSNSPTSNPAKSKATKPAEDLYKIESGAVAAPS